MAPKTNSTTIEVQLQQPELEEYLLAYVQDLSFREAAMPTRSDLARERLLKHLPAPTLDALIKGLVNAGALVAFPSDVVATDGVFGDSVRYGFPADDVVDEEEDTSL